MYIGDTEAMIELCTRNDDITLEYNDTVLLLFTPDESDLIEFYESYGEYIRESMYVHIVDNNRKWTILAKIDLSYNVIYYLL